ncbi:MAG: hypothetical protein WC612_06305 [Bdellovibrionales bacterium]
MYDKKTVKIYIPLLDEGAPTLRPTQAISLGGDLYKILPTPDYDPEDETWEFLPSSVVRCDKIVSSATGEKVLRAREVRMPDGSFHLSDDLQQKK